MGLLLYAFRKNERTPSPETTLAATISSMNLERTPSPERTPEAIIRQMIIESLDIILGFVEEHNAAAPIQAAEVCEHIETVIEQLEQFEECPGAFIDHLRADIEILQSYEEGRMSLEDARRVLDLEIDNLQRYQEMVERRDAEQQDT